MPDTYVILRRIYLSDKNQSTGKTCHYQGNKVLSDFVELQIVRFHDDSGYYLFYCDETGAEITDTYHDSIEEALAQAEWEFDLRPDEWTVICD
jgi:hypothetical protein